MDKYLYVLMIDSSGTTHSLCVDLIGVVMEEKEAERFVKESNLGYAREYRKVKLVKRWEECL